MKRSNEHGFTLVEAIIALVLAASGLALMFQSIGGAAKLQAATIELTKTRIVAQNILSQSNANSQNSNGILDGIAWTLTTEPIAQNSSGNELVRIKVLASGPSQRQFYLSTETLRGPS